MELLKIKFKNLTDEERMLFAKKYKFSELSESKKLEIKNWQAWEDNRRQIRSLLALPPNQRTNFLRVSVSGRGTVL
jgi:hypothetical protein